MALLAMLRVDAVSGSAVKSDRTLARTSVFLSGPMPRPFMHARHMGIPAISRSAGTLTRCLSQWGTQIEPAVIGSELRTRSPRGLRFWAAEPSRSSRKASTIPRVSARRPRRSIHLSGREEAPEQESVRIRRKRSSRSHRTSCSRVIYPHRHPLDFASSNCACRFTATDRFLFH